MTGTQPSQRAVNSLLDTKTSGESTEVQEFTETATTQDIEEPSETRTPRKSEDTEEIGESTETQKEADTKTTETSMDMQSLEAQTDGESAPLYSQTGALVPVESSPSSPSFSLLGWLWSFIYFPECLSYFTSWLPWSANDSQIHRRKEEPASFNEKMNNIKKIILRAQPTFLRIHKRYQTVGIFSRSSEMNYEWLIKQLKSEAFHSTVLPHTISNNGMRQFREDVSRCTFGILYHTKNRGRINIVDVTSSLYDKELKYLSEHLGKEKVIVIVDDVEDASDAKKTWFLQSQPSIGQLAKDIFLFSADEKKKL